MLLSYKSLATVSNVLLSTVVVLASATTAGYADPIENKSDVAKSPKRPKIGLALGGGGTRGAAHIGVLKVLEQEGIPIDFIAGTSMGAIIGGLYDSGVSLRELEQRGVDGSIMNHFMTIPIKLRIATAPIVMLPRLVGYRPYDGLYRGNRFRKYLVKLIPGNEQMIEDLPIPYCAVVLSLKDGKVHTLCRGSLEYAMQASSAVPAIRKPVEIDDDLFVDGGVADNIPVQQAKDMGADIVIAVNVDENLHDTPLKAFHKLGSVTNRMVTWELWFHDAPLCKQADIVIHPDVDGITLLSRKRKDAQRAIVAGEQAAQLALPAIRAKLANYSCQNDQLRSPAVVRLAKARQRLAGGAK